VNTVRQITNKLAIAGQPSFNEFKQLAEAGYRSVANLRSPNETGFPYVLTWVRNVHIAVEGNYGH